MFNKYFYYILFLISFSIAVYSYISVSEIYENRSRLYDYQDTLNSLAERNNELKEKLEYRKTDEFVVKEAREKLNYGLEGERIYIVPKDSDSSNEEENESISGENSVSLNNEAGNQNVPTYELWFKTFF